MNEKKIRMQRLVQLLNEASRAYYQEAAERMSNFEYDRLYDELAALETELGVQLSQSPTARVGYEVLGSLPKERHESPMLSLDKTKDVEALAAFIGDQKAVISWKLDGLTVVLTYRDGELFKAVTRGNGEVGEVITANARAFGNVPLRIPYRGELILRGEAVIGYRDFERINREIPDADAKYKNPRNLCSGSVRQLDSAVTAKRNVQFFAFALVRADGVEFENSRLCQFDWLDRQGFSVVEHYPATQDTVRDLVQDFASRIAANDVPSDGLVVTYDDIAYGQSLGRTAKFPRDSYAFKWQDEICETVLKRIEWSPSRTGLINPVAVFEPVELEGTTVSRASVHNVSVMEDLELGVGDTIQVYKANMIIPQIADNLTRSGVKDIPTVCPACGGPAKVQKLGDTKALYCMNPDCGARRIKSLCLLAGRDALNIEGLSEMTMEKLVGRGFIREPADIFHLSRYADEISGMEGFGEKSCENLLAGIEKARTTTADRALYGIGIPGVGAANAKLILRAFGYDTDRLLAADEETLGAISGVGPVIAHSCVAYFADERKRERFLHLLRELKIQKPQTDGGAQPLQGKGFVITGSLAHFANRGELKQKIEALGGRVAGSVSKKTDYLINNDTGSASAKNKKAKELGICVISEEDFLAMIGEG